MREGRGRSLQLPRPRDLLGGMASAGCSRAIPVWLNEEDLNCIICHGLLDCPATLPCGHNFCGGCLTRLRDAGRGWACPTCRQDWPRPPPLKKNTQLQELVDKYARAAREVDSGPEPALDHAHAHAHQLPPVGLPRPLCS